LKKDFAFLSPPVVFALIAIVAVLTIVVIIFLPIGTGARVTVNGHIQHVSGEGVNSVFDVFFDDYSQKEDPCLLNTGQPGLWFWDNEESVKIKLFIEQQECGSVEVKSGTWFASPVSFSIEARHISSGTKSCRFEAYVFSGGLLGLGATEHKVGETSFSLNIGEW